MSLDYSKLKDAVKTGAALRRKTELQPAGGKGDKIFPPTYAGAVYAMEYRRIPGRNEPVPCVLLNSTQSEANAGEEALQDAVDDGRIEIPVVEVDFSEIPIVEPGSKDAGLYEPIGRVTSLQVPHRIADAILRDSELEGVAFRRTTIGKKLSQATLRNATPLFEICPTALIFGIWDSTGPKGGLGVKFQRALVSEIIGIDAELGVKTSSRIDPIFAKNPPLYQSAASDNDYVVNQADAAKDSKGNAKQFGKKLSELNLGNVTPSLSKSGSNPLGDSELNVYLAGGVTVRRAEQTTVLSFPALRRLRFPVGGSSKSNADSNLVAQTALAALGICSAVLASERGLDLRSRCLLWPSEIPTWELLSQPGETAERFQITADEAVELLQESITRLDDAKLPWIKEPMVLKPSKRLVDLVRKSQELAVTSGAEDGGE